MDEGDLEQRLARAALVVGTGQEAPRLAVHDHGVIAGVHPAGLVPGPDQVVGRLVGALGRAPVVGEQWQRYQALLLAQQLLQPLRHLAVKLHPPGVEQPVVRRLLHQPVAERVDGSRPPLPLDDQLGTLQVGQPGADVEIRATRSRIGSVNLLPITAATLSSPRAGGESLSNRACSAPCTAPGTASSSAPSPRSALVAHGLGDEQRVAARPLGHCRGRIVGHRAARRLDCQAAGRVLGQRPQLDLAVAVRIALAGPLADRPRGRVALTAVEQDEADRLPLGELVHPLQQVERAVVGPVQVLEHQADRVVAADPHQQPLDGLDVWRLSASPDSSRSSDDSASVRMPTPWPGRGTDPPPRRTAVPAAPSGRAAAAPRWPPERLPASRGSRRAPATAGSRTRRRLRGPRAPRCCATRAVPRRPAGSCRCPARR